RKMNISSEEVILSEDMGIEEVDKRILMKIVSYSKDSMDLNELVEVMMIHNNIQIRTRLLTAYLRLANLLSTKKTRTLNNYYAITLSFDVDLNEKFKWIKEQIIQGFFINPENYTITLYFIKPSEKQLKEIKLSFDWNKYYELVDLVKKNIEKVLLSVLPIMAQERITYYVNINIIFQEIYFEKEDLQNFFILINDYPITLSPNAFKLLNLLQKDKNAINSYDDKTIFDPNKAKTWNNKGLSLLMLGKYEEAISCFNMAIGISPEDPELLINEGKALLMLKKYEDAIKRFEKAIKLNPKLPDAYENRGLAYLEMHQYNLALNDFKMLNKLLIKSEQFEKLKKVYTYEELAQNALDLMDELKPIDNKFINWLKYGD
ncbi:MAG: tetratricopeptide repeat protein, partial [Promethearchaeota archaeon]